MKTIRNIFMVSLAIGAGANICRADADLPVPYYWQDGAGWCWATSATMVARYYKNTSDALQIKPWNSASIVGADKDTGNFIPQAKDVLGVYLPGTVFPIESWTGVDSQRVANRDKIIKSLDSKHPVYLELTSRGHVIVLTGYKGNDWNKGIVYINDPSGYSFGNGGQGGNTSQIHGSASWGTLFDYVDSYYENTGKTPIDKYLGDDIYYMSAKSLGSRSQDILTIDLCPQHGTAAGMITNDAESESLAIEWNGADGFPGYLWKQSEKGANKKKRPNLGSPIGHAFLDSDTLEFSPILNNASGTSLNAQVVLEIFDDSGKKLLNKTANTAVRPRGFPGASKQLFTVKVSDFHKPKKGEENNIFFYRARLVANSSPSQDFVTVRFAVAPEFARHVAVVMDSSGSNVDTDPSNLRISAGKRTLDALTSEDQAKQRKVREDLGAVVDFDSFVSVLADFMDPPKAKPFLDLIDSSGGTDIAAGINQGVTLLDNAGVLGTESQKTNKSAICLFTDGVNNAGPQPVVDAINAAAAKGIRIHYGFLSPLAVNKRKAFGGAAPATPATIQEAVLASGGTYGTITDDVSQLAFVDQILQTGMTSGDSSTSRILGHLFLTFNLPEGAKSIYHTFKGKKNEVVTIKVESSNFSSNIAVLDRDYTPLKAISEVQGEGASEVTVKLPRDGDFKVILLANDGGFGTYRILADVENDIVIPGEVVTEMKYDLTPALNKQSGLFEQKVTVTLGDGEGQAATAFRVEVTGLAKDVKVSNLSGVTASGVQYIDSNGILEPGQSAKLIIKYYVPNREIPKPKLKLKLVTTAS